MLARGLVVTLLLLLTLQPGGTAAQPEVDLRAAGAVVMQQLDAFRRDDFDTAFGFASAEIHALFDRGRFEQMVRGGYPEIARSASATVEGVQRTDDPDRLYLFVRVRGESGGVVEALYEMVREPAGWRINGVVTRPDAGEKA